MVMGAGLTGFAMPALLMHGPSWLAVLALLGGLATVTLGSML
jgi:hypothetical protein